MRRVVWAATFAALAASCIAQQQYQPGYIPPRFTWAQVVQGAANNPKIVEHQPFKKEVKPYDNYRETAYENTINDGEERYQPGNDYDNMEPDYIDDENTINDGEERYQPGNDYDYMEPNYIDDEQFKNVDYVYVDDIEDVENPEEFQLKDEHENRRTLDFLYHTFLQPVLQPDQPAEPSLIGEVFRVIDNHISKDFTSLANLIQGSATVNPIPEQAYGTPVATGIAAGPTGDDLLVTDDLGNQHLVSVDDIVRSLSVLDEGSLVDLLLGPAGGADPALSIQLPPGSQISQAPDLPATQTASAPLNNFQLPAPAPAPLPVPVTLSTSSPLVAGVPLAITQNLPTVQQNIQQNIRQNSIDTNGIVILPGQLTKAIRNVAAAQGGEVFRPVRHTGPANPVSSDEEESFLVTDEQGNVQIISMDDILSSLSNLDEETLASLLVDTSVASQTTSNSSLPSKTLISIPGSTPEAIAASLPTVPLIETDLQGNVHISPLQSGSTMIDLNDHTAEHSKLEEPVLSNAQSVEEILPTTNKKNVVSSDGTQIRTDENGNIYLTPDPNKPFTLDIQNIIRLAEQAEQGQTKEDKATVFSGAVVNQLPGTKTSTTPSPQADRGNEILAYLAGIDGFGPIPSLPGPLRPVEPQQTVQPQVTDLRTALLNQLLLQQTTPAPATPGIGAQFSGLLSRIVNQAAQVVGAQPVTPAPQQQDEVVQLVVRQQFEDGGEEIYGNINVPLPQSIHHSQLSLQKLQRQQGNRNSAVSNGAQRRQDTAPNWTSGLPQPVIDAILSGINNQENTFDPANAVRREDSPLEQSNWITKQIMKTSENQRSDYLPVQAVPAEERDSHYAVHYHDGPQPAYEAPAPVYAAPHPVYAPQPVVYEQHPVKEKKDPLFDLYLLFDHNKAKKLGDKTNLSVGKPLIGDPAYFVDTRSHGYH